jgi:hypothetical protein
MAKNTRQEISQAGNFIWGSSVKKARVKVRWDSLIHEQKEGLES